MHVEKNIVKASLQAGGNISIGDVHNYYQGFEKDYPNGVNTLSNYLFNGNKPNKYKQYLSNNILEYFSRDEYKAKNLKSEIITEADIINKTLNNSLIEGCIISGEGGVGKTRLLIQLGLHAFSIKWNVLFLTPRFSDIKELSEYLGYTGSIKNKHNGNHLLIIDYIEECPWFNPDFVEEILKYKPGLKIKIIANCRNSFIGSLQYPDSYYQVKLDNSESEKDYRKNVINKILSSVTIENITSDKLTFFTKKPSFAVFLRYLYDTGKEIDVSSSGDFKQWIKKRFVSSINKKDDIQSIQNIIIFLMCLPSKIELFENNQELIAQFGKLINDGWIEEIELINNEVYYQVIHDTITDELLTIILESLNRTQFSFFNESIKFATSYGLVSNWFRAFERISGDDSFDLKLFKRQIENWINKDKYLNNNKIDIATTSILTEEERFIIISNNKEFFSDYLKDIVFGLPLSYAMNVFSKTDSLPTDFKNLADNWLQNNQEFDSDKNIATRVISTYVKLFGITPNVSFHLEHYFTLPPSNLSSFVIRSVLKYEGKTDSIESYIIEYLESYSHSKEASYVLRQWMSIGGELNKIKPYLINHLTIHSKDKDSSYLLSGWLNKNGEIKIIERYLFEYLTINASNDDARYVLSGYLSKSSNPCLVKESLLKYLHKNSSLVNSAFPMKDWLDRSCNPSVIEAFVLEYLNKNLKNSKSHFILGSWIINNGNLKTIKKYLLDYLSFFSEAVEVGYLLKSWLEKGGILIAIESNLIKYLSLYASSKDSLLILKSWIDSDGNKKLILPYLRTFLENNTSIENTSLVLCAWLDKGGSSNNIKDFLIRYLEENSKTKAASYVITSWLANSCDTEVVKPFIIDNLTDEEINPFILTKWIEQDGDKNLILPHLISYLQKNSKLKESNHVLKAWLTSEGELEIVINFLQEHLSYNSTEINSRYLFDVYLNKSYPIEPIKNYFKEFLNKNSGRLDTSFVISPFLKHYNDLEFIKPYFETWLQNYAQRKQSRFDIQQWLVKSKDWNFIKPFVIKWLDRNYKYYEACYILQAYLEKSNDYSTIAKTVKDWLQIFIQIKDSNYLLQACVENETNEVDVVELCKKWLAKYGGDFNAHFLLRVWLSKYKYELLRTEIDRWLNQYSGSNAAVELKRMIN